MKKKRKPFRVPKGHGWTARPGCQVFVADRGAVRFDIPRTWVVRPNEDGIKMHEREPPDDDCVLGISYLRIPLINWTGLPLTRLVRELTDRDRRLVEGWDEIVEAHRADLEIAWRQGRFIDRDENRRAITRLSLARRGRVKALLTMDYWETEAKRFDPVWHLVLETLVLDEPITNPWLGPQVH